MRMFTVRFRDKMIEVVVDSDSGYDPETNTREIEWHFFGVDPEEHDAMNVTSLEDDDIYDQLCKVIDEG